jgi:nitrate/nitrite transport system substrate-binding protein
MTHLHHPGCGCHSQDLPAAQSDELEQHLDRRIESALLAAVVPHAPTRRRFLQAVGVNTALAALASVLPVGAMQALAKEPGPLEKKDLAVGFLPITCATPIVLAGALGFYAKQGLNVSLMKTAGWAVVRDKTLNGEYDASHMLSPMPLAISLGLGSTATPMVVPVIENINGNAITLHVKHKDKRDPKQWKGMTFAIPFDYSMHNFLLRHYLAENGVNPDKDVKLRVMPPPDMVANLRSGTIDGFIVAEPFNQRAVYDGIGFMHLLTSEIWDGHPCCAFAVPGRFASANPNTFAALFRAIVGAALYARQSQNRANTAQLISVPNYLNQPVTVVEQVLTGRFADGLGGIRQVPNRIDFDPFPWQSTAVWMMTQMKRWGYLKRDVNYRQVAEQVFLATDARKRMAELGYQAPAQNFTTHTILGRRFEALQA